MSVSTERLVRYAKGVIDGDVVQEVLRRVDEKNLARFRAGSPEIRAMVSSCMDADMTFLAECHAIVAENTPVNPDDDEIIKVPRGR
tara:strand:- start:32428 stop:32685 length:258 start_codon:yes stop_codon:yes gene_type:complete